MKNISELLKTIAEQTPKGVVYPSRLLSNHKQDIKLDQEVLSYLVHGGEAGAYYHWLTLLIQYSDAKLIVELGNRYGSSTIAMYHELKKDQMLISLDIVKDQRYVTPEIFDSPNVKFIYGDCIDLNTFKENNANIPINIDILFTDTIHTYEQIASEYEIYEPLLSDEALFVIDDINLNDKRKFWDELTSHTKHDLTKLCHGSGFGAVHYIRPKLERTKTKEERIQIALQRSASIWKNRFYKLNNSPSLLYQRIHELRTTQRKKWIKETFPKFAASLRWVQQTFS